MTKRSNAEKIDELSAKNFPIICIGGSAGSVDACIRLMPNLRPDMGVACVIVNHMRTMSTRLHTVLSTYTTMPVELIKEALPIKPNCVFVIPSNQDLHILNGKFHLTPLSKKRGWPDVISVFLRSLKNSWNGKLIAIIVSGCDSDGADALCDIKEVGGVTIAQKLTTAKYPDMPKSAIESGCIDFVLSPEEIAQKLLRLCSISSSH